MKIKSKDLINLRNTLSKDITHYWLIIRKENIMSKKQVRNYDLDVLLNQIKQKAEQRAKIKLFIQALNMGYTDFAEFKKDTNFETIFALSEKNEQLVQLGQIDTLSAATKAAKGKKTLPVTEIFSSAKIRSLQKKTQIEINKLNKQLEKFNDTAELIIDDSMSNLLAA